MIPDPEEFGWKWNEDWKHLFEPIMTTYSPAHESILELSMCSCKTGCNIGRCKCQKNQERITLYRDVSVFEL